jgi:hypothetical protein
MTKDIRSLNGNSAVAEAMRQINPDVLDFTQLLRPVILGVFFLNMLRTGLLIQNMFVQNRNMQLFLFV